jgi:hypothetical protein
MRKRFVSIVSVVATVGTVVALVLVAGASWAGPGI